LSRDIHKRRRSGNQLSFKVKRKVKSRRMGVGEKRGRRIIKGELSIRVDHAMSLVTGPGRPKRRRSGGEKKIGVYLSSIISVRGGERGLAGEKQERGRPGGREMP